MKNAVVVAGVAAAFLVVAPGAAFATTPSVSPSVPTATRTPDPDGPITRVTRQLTVSPAKAVPGARVNLDFACQTRGPEEKVLVQSAALTFGKPGDPRRWAVGTVKNVKPGKYAVTLHCGYEDSVAWIEVLPAGQPAPQQVAKVPSGAPQTGGTDGPVDGSGFPAAAAMGVLAVGGTGLVLARRARRR
ncbi:hypothetical protein [Amycolatopsis tolypomycina]|uniref:hypothetical protein n=1 Tax=Amycolatopsis tolypomycina TaxID=208445 RepID=UPI0033B8EF4C